MHILQFDAQTCQVQVLEHSELCLPDAGSVLWLDIKPADTNWQQLVEEKLGFSIDESHLKDTLNLHHPPYYDASEHYEMLIFPALTQTQLATGSFQAQTSPIVFFIREQILISVHVSGQTSLASLRDKWFKGSRLRPPITSATLLSLLLLWLTDHYLNLRIPFANHLEHWQQQLLNPGSRFNDWSQLLGASSQLRKYRISIITPQEEALTTWLEETDLEMEPRVTVRFHDILEHFRRVSRDAEGLQNDLENLVQIYFSATNQRTNEIIRILTIASVIFLPLNLLAGIFGMNFVHIPGLHDPYGFFILLGGMIVLSLGLLWVLLWKRWL